MRTMLNKQKLELKIWDQTHPPKSAEDEEQYNNSPQQDEEKSLIDPADQHRLMLQAAILDTLSLIAESVGQREREEAEQFSLRTSVQ